MKLPLGLTMKDFVMVAAIAIVVRYLSGHVSFLNNAIGDGEGTK